MGYKAYTSLHIECTDTVTIGHCWTRYDFLVTSRKQLKDADLRQLFDLGFISGGQEFWVTSPCDGTEKRNEDFSYEYKCVVRADSSG